MRLIRSPATRERTRAPRSLTAAMTPASTGFLGLAVLAVMLQSSGGFAVELLGPDLLLAAAGFVVTRSLLDSATTGSGRIAPLSWYREQMTLNGPLLLLVPLAVVVITVAAGANVAIGRTVGDLVTEIVPTGNWWELTVHAGQTDRVDPLGPLWLVGLLVQFCLVWPVLLAVLHRITDAQYERRLVTVLTPVLVVLAAGSWLVGPLRGHAGADLAELALGGHVRAVEWLAGAAAAAAAAGLGTGRRRASRREGPALVVVGTLLLVAMAVAATVRPEEWLRLAGPGAAAVGGAVLLLAVHLPGSDALGRALGTGLPMELGRMAFPLLLLHSLVFWMIQLALPAVRPVALLAVGGALAWLLGLLLHDGVVRRVRRMQLRWPRLPAMVVLGVAMIAVTVLASGRVMKVGYSTPERPGGPGLPTVLVLGGAYAGNVARALDRPGARYTVVDGSRPGCGLIAEPMERETLSQARTTALAQLPGAVADCGSWARWWDNRISSTRPDVIVLDLTVDALPRVDASAAPGSSPCTPAFRATFRERMAEAVRLTGEGNAARPVFLTTRQTAGASPGAADVDAGRCFNALLVESVASYQSVRALPLGVGAVELPAELTTALTPR